MDEGNGLQIRIAKASSGVRISLSAQTLFNIMKELFDPFIQLL